MVFSGARRFGLLLVRGRVRAVVVFAAAAVMLGVGLSAPAKGRGWVLRATRGASESIPGVFQGAAATSARDVWAVGSTRLGPSQTLIAHWNGAAWARVPSPSPGSFASLAGVAATSAGNGWAVGSYYTRAAGSRRLIVRALILHWNGHVWSRVRGPVGELSGVAASSRSNAWAVGSGKGGTLILHWNGHAWSRVPSPSRGSKALTDLLNSVAIGPGNAAWAVGEISCSCGPGVPLIERWNGRRWRVVRSPTVGGGTDLTGVTSIGARDAWAVGASGSGTAPERTVILRWNGHAWKHVASPSPDPSASLSALARVSPRDIWAVGSGSNRKRTRFKTVVLHWNGGMWK